MRKCMIFNSHVFLISLAGPALAGSGGGFAHMMWGGGPGDGNAHMMPRCDGFCGML